MGQKVSFTFSCLVLLKEMGRTGSPGFQLVALVWVGELWGGVGAGVLCLIPVVGGGGPAGGLGALAVSAVGLCIVGWAGFRVASGWAGALGVECGWMVGCKCMDFVTTGLRTRKWLRIFIEL